MKKFKGIISMFLVLVIVILSVVSTYAMSSANVIEELNYENKISPDLQSTLEKMDADDKVKVAVWLNDIESEEKDKAFSNRLLKEKEKGNISAELYADSISYQNVSKSVSKKPSLNEVQVLSSIKRSSYKELHVERNNNWKNSLGKKSNNTEIIYVSNYAPVVFFETSKSDLNEIAFSNEVEYIYPFNDEIAPSDSDTEIEQSSISDELPDYGVWQNITNIRTMRDGMGYDGSGIKIGVIEDGVPDISNEALSNSNVFIVNDDSATNHATNTATILVGNTADYTGVVPEATLYCAGVYRNYFEPLELLLDYNINILNVSNSLSAYPPNTYGTWSKYIDYIIYNYNITVCAAAGNTTTFPHAITGAAMSYNSIAVGNLDDKNTLTYNDDEIHITSCYESSNTEAYKPDICAPGDKVATPIYPQRSSDGNGGTSSATPIVSGICAMLMQAEPSLTARPMLIKSVLMSSAKRVPNMEHSVSTATTTAPALSRRYGAGLVNVTKAYDIVQSEKWDYIPLVTADQNQNPYIVNVNVSQNAINSSKNLAVSLNWTQKVIATSLSNSIVYDVYHHDLGVYDPNGNLVAYSNYLYDRKQFVYFQPNVAGIYQIRVYKTGTAQAGSLTAISYNLS